MPHDDDSQDLFVPIAESLPKIKPLTPVQRRLMEAAAREEAQKILFQHTVLAQTSLPYRDPGAGVREWRREQGAVSLKIDAGEARHPDSGEWVKLGLLWGTKPRLILAHLNREALLRESPEIEVGDSLTEFVKRIRGFKHGREIRAFKDQLGRLSAALVRLAMTRDGRGFQIDTKVVSGFELWFPKDERQRVLWPSYVRLSLDYYESLRKHIRIGDVAHHPHTMTTQPITLAEPSEHYPRDAKRMPFEISAGDARLKGCLVCRAPLEGRRSHAQVCSNRCRVARSRRSNLRI